MKRLKMCFVLCAVVCLSVLFEREAVGALDLTEIAVTARPEFTMGGAFDGERYMIGLQLDGQNIAVQFVSASGLPDGNPIPIPGAAGMPPAVAYGSNVYLMAWVGIDDGSVNPDGTLFLDNNMQISASDNGDEDDSNLSIGFDGQNFLVVYSSEPRTISEDGEDVYGRFISPVSGLAGDSFVIDQNNIPSSNPTATVFADDRYAVLFHESLATANAESWQIYARLVSTNGVVSGERIYIAGNETVAAQFPFMGWNGTNYLVALRESMPIPADNEDFIDTNGVIRARWFDAEM